jgi:TetR/AcrR family transcriptional repressor of nem operon
MNSDTRAKIVAAGRAVMVIKGFTAAGLNEILAAAGVPKGSFYHFFESKDSFGKTVLESYFEDYLANLGHTLEKPGLTMAQRLVDYWGSWSQMQSSNGYEGRCLAVKLGAEVPDLSESMRHTLKRGSAAIIARLKQAIIDGLQDGSIAIDDTPERVAQGLYELWLGSSVVVKIARNIRPFESAMAMTRTILHLGTPPENARRSANGAKSVKTRRMARAATHSSNRN